MDDLSTLTAQPRVLRVGGRDYKVHPLTIGDFGKLQSWIDSQFPDPFEVVNRAIKNGNYNVAQQQFLLNSAMEKASAPRHLIGTFEADELLMSIEGGKQMLFLSISKGDPSFTKEDADELFGQLTPIDIANVQQATNLNMVVSDPKPEPLDVKPRSRTSGSATSRRPRDPKSTGGKSSTKR